MANLMPEIARMLGVELGEEFQIDGDILTYEFRRDGLYGDYGIASEALEALICGNAKIVKLPWKPKKGETYYTFELLGSKWVVRPSWYGGFPNEYALFEKGWVYRTRTEAEAALPKVAAEMGVEYEL